MDGAWFASSAPPATGAGTHAQSGSDGTTIQGALAARLEWRRRRPRFNELTVHLLASPPQGPRLDKVLHTVLAALEPHHLGRALRVGPQLHQIHAAIGPLRAAQGGLGMQELLGSGRHIPRGAARCR